MTADARKPQEFTYLLNAMENAAQASDPSTAGYGLARLAVLEYVEKLEAGTRYVPLPATMELIDAIVALIEQHPTVVNLAGWDRLSLAFHAHPAAHVDRP